VWVNADIRYMRASLLPSVSIAFGIPWIVFGIQHFIYADFVSSLVPAYMPAHAFWVYLTGGAMIAAGISFIIRRLVRLAAVLLGCMLLLFILMLHPLLLSKEPQVAIHWTRVMQDTAIMGASFGLAFVSGWTQRQAAVIARYCYALPLMVLGAQHFTHNVFVTAKIPDYFPWKEALDYLVGVMLIGAGWSILFTSWARPAAAWLGLLLLTLLLLHHIPLLAGNVRNAIDWTGAMLDLALAAGAFIISACISPLQRSGGQESASMLPG
jgi:uncharacterized membrane protein